MARNQAREGKLNEAMEISTKILQTAATKTSRRRHAQIWFDRDCCRERKETLQALDRARKYNEQEDLTYYAEKRRRYKQLLKGKREEYIEKEAKKLAEEAKKDPILALKKRASTTIGEIPIETWETHFDRLCNGKLL